MTGALTVIVAAALLASPGKTETIRVGPDPCPVPADAEPYVAPDDVHAEDLSPWRDLASAPVIFDADLGRRRDGVLFQRFAIDPETGKIIGFSPRTDECEPAPR